jgi:hypothetical protein
MATKTLHSITPEIINSVYLKVKETLVDIKGVNGRTQYKPWYLQSLFYYVMLSFGSFSCIIIR